MRRVGLRLRRALPLARHGRHAARSPAGRAVSPLGVARQQAAIQEPARRERALALARPARSAPRDATRRSCGCTNRNTSRGSRKPTPPGAATRATARRSGRGRSRSRDSPQVVAWSLPTRCSTVSSTARTRSCDRRAITPSRRPVAASACSATSRSRSCTCAPLAASRASPSWTGTCITATAPRRRSCVTRTCWRSPCTRTGCTRSAAARSRTWARARGAARPINIPLPAGSASCRLPRGARAGRRRPHSSGSRRSSSSSPRGSTQARSTLSGACSCVASTTARSPTCSSRRPGSSAGAGSCCCHEGGYSAVYVPLLRRGDRRGPARHRSGRRRIRSCRRISRALDDRPVLAHELAAVEAARDQHGL